MKSKIRIMNAKPEVTDEEIRSHMDFDKLLAQSKELPVRRRIPDSIRKASIGLTGIAAVFCLWYFTRFNTKETIADITDSQKNKELRSTNPVDSIVVRQQQEVSKTKNEKSRLQPPSRADKISSKMKDPVKVIDSQDSIQAASVLNESVPMAVYVQAEPVTGYPALYEYFSRELKYPQAAVKDSVQGVVVVVFSINTVGKPEKVSIEQSLGPAFDQEAIRIIENMPAWKPAAYNRKPVASKISLPLTFQIKKLKTKNQ